jgi:hypothetical protein
LKVEWVWADGQLPGIGSGRRRVKVTDHPTRKGYVKVYSMSEGYPVVMGRDEFEALVVQVD